MERPSGSVYCFHQHSNISIEMVDVWVQEDRLWIADPRAINHILQKSSYLYEKPSNARERIALLGDSGVASVEGEYLSFSSRSVLSLI